MQNVAAKFARKFEPVTETGCWIWTGAELKGYGRMVVNGKYLRAHRISWELYRGPIPDGLLVLHHCDVPACVNPDHLYLGSDLDNMRDRLRRGRNPNANKVACLRGHPYDAANTILHNGKRYCRKCREFHNANRSHS